MVIRQQTFTRVRGVSVIKLFSAMGNRSFESGLINPHLGLKDA